MKFQKLERLDYCLNCGAKEIGNYCPECGQENENKTASVGSLIKDFLADVASFDSKFVHTLVPLMTKPGFLTNEYNAGRRVRYLSPVKMYLVLSVIFFLFLSRNVSHTNLRVNDTSAKQDIAEAKRDVAESTDGVIQIGNTTDSIGTTEADYEKKQLLKKPSDRDKGFARFFKIRLIRAKTNPKLLTSEIMNTFPKMMFVLLPVFALVLKLIYIRSKRLYVEHLIFSLHGHSFVFTVFSIDFFLPGILVFLSIIGTAVYLFKSMRKVYGQGFLKTLVKFILLYVIYVTIFAFALGLAILFSMAML